MNLINDIKSTMDLGKELKVFLASFKGTILGTARVHAINAQTEILKVLEVEASNTPTLDERNEGDQNGVDEGSPEKEIASVSPDQDGFSPYVQLDQAAWVIQFMQDEDGIWEHDEGVRGTVKHLIKSNTCAVDIDEEEAIFGDDDPQAMRDAQVMAQKKADLERFEHKIVAGVDQAVADASDAEGEPEWLADCISKAAKNQRSKLRVMFRRGTINADQAKKSADWLKGLLILTQ